MKKYILSTTAIVLALIGSAFTSSYRSNTWVFKGNASQILQASQYETGISERPGCGSGANLPCSIQADAANQEDLQSFLDTKTSSEVTAMSSNKRD